MGWDYTKRSIHIESKIYFLEFDQVYRGSGAKIRESSNRGIFSLSIQFVSLIWLWECFQDLVASKDNLKFFKQTRCDDYTLWVEKISTRRGNVAEVFKLDNNGHKCSLMIPEGTKKEGWILFRSLIEDYPGKREKLIPPQSSAKVITGNTDLCQALKKGKQVGELSQDFKEALKKGKQVVDQSEATECHLKINAQQDFEFASSFASDATPFEQINWDTTIVITRRFFHQDWIDISSMLKQEFSPYCSISPFHPNRALLNCRSEQLAQHLCSFSGWNSFNDFQVMFEFWNPSIHAKMDVVPTYGGWLKVRNLPLHLWNSETLVSIGDKCGGCVEISSKTVLFRETMEALVKVKGNYTGFIPAEVEVVDESGSSFMVQITTHFSVPLLLKKVDRVHGVLTKEMEDDFFSNDLSRPLVQEKWIPVKGRSTRTKETTPPTVVPSARSDQKANGGLPKTQLIVCNTKCTLEAPSEVFGGTNLADMGRCDVSDKLNHHYPPSVDVEERTIAHFSNPRPELCVSAPDKAAGPHLYGPNISKGPDVDVGLHFPTGPKSLGLIKSGDALSLPHHQQLPRVSPEPSNFRLLKRQIVGEDPQNHLFVQKHFSVTLAGPKIPGNH